MVLEQASLVTKKLGLYKEMDELVQSVGISPNSKFKDNYFIGWANQVELPYKYCHTQIYKDSVPEESKKDMIDYNNIARDYVHICIENKKIQTVINTLDVNKKYKLTVEVASKLGF